ANNIGQPAFDRIAQLSSQGHELKQVAFAPNGGWVVLYDGNGYSASNISSLASGLLTRLHEINNQGLPIKSVSFGLNDSWAVVFNYNGIYANAAKSLTDRVAQLWNTNTEITGVSFDPTGG